MAPLTSPGCDSCHWLNQRINELDGRLSVLYQLREEEIMESMVVALVPAANSTSTRELDLTVPLQCLDSTVTSVAAHWSLLGVRPKALANFTPAPRPRMTPRCGKSSTQLTYIPAPPVVQYVLHPR